MNKTAIAQELAGQVLSLSPPNSAIGFYNLILRYAENARGRENKEKSVNLMAIMLIILQFCSVTRILEYCSFPKTSLVFPSREGKTKKRGAAPVGSIYSGCLGATRQTR